VNQRRDKVAEYPDMVNNRAATRGTRVNGTQFVRGTPTARGASAAGGATRARAVVNGTSVAGRAPILHFVDTCSPEQALQINEAITKFVVGCGLSFSTVESPFLKDLLQVCRPAFIAGDHLRRRQWFSTTGLDALHADVKARLQQRFESSSSTRFVTLAADGFKTETGRKVVNFTEQVGSAVAFKDSIV